MTIKWEREREAREESFVVELMDGNEGSERVKPRLISTILSEV
jgi:hypothetical protein